MLIFFFFITIMFHIPLDCRCDSYLLASVSLRNLIPLNVGSNCYFLTNSCDNGDMPSCGCVSLDGKGESVDFDLVLGSTRSSTKDHRSHMQPERVFIFWEQKFQHAGVYCSSQWQPPQKHTGSFQAQQGEFQGGEVSLGTDSTKSLQVVLGLVGSFSS